MDENSNDAMGLLQVYGVKIWCLIGESADVRSTRYVLRTCVLFLQFRPSFWTNFNISDIKKQEAVASVLVWSLVRITQKCWNSSNSVWSISTMVKSNKQGFYF